MTNIYYNIDDKGNKFWHKGDPLNKSVFDDLHRLDGPAIEWSDGTGWWFEDGKQHRLDGPAVEWLRHKPDWYFEGKQIECSSQKEFERIIKLKAFL